MSRICKKCGGEVGREDLYCIHCGVPLEKEPVQEMRRETPENENTAAPLGVGAYLMIGVILAIPIVNIIAAIFWAIQKESNPNRRNLARAWLILVVVGSSLGGLFTIGLLRAIYLDSPHHWEYDWHHYYPEEEYWEELPFEWEEV